MNYNDELMESLKDTQEENSDNLESSNDIFEFTNKKAILETLNQSEEIANIIKNLQDK